MAHIGRKVVKIRLNFNFGNFKVNSKQNRYITVFTILTGFLVAGYGGMQYVEQGEKLENAEKINATVTSTGIEKTTVSRHKGTTVKYLPLISFEYTYNGENYSSDNLYPTEASHSEDIRDEAEEIINQYPKKETVKAYLDPENPGDAFLRDQRTNRPLYLAGIGLLMSIFAIRSMWKT